MKKSMIYLCCLILCLSFLTGCAEPEVYYSSYSNGMYASLDVLWQIPGYSQPGFRGPFHAYQFWHYVTEDFAPNEKAPAQLPITIGGLRLVGEYQGIAATTDLSYLPDKYKSGIYHFWVHPDNGQLVYFNYDFHKGEKETENFFLELRALPELDDPKEDSQRIAQEVAGDYIDVSEYRMKYGGKEEHYHNFSDAREKSCVFDVYEYHFVRYINDIPTTDYISISITSKGSIDKIQRGEVNAFQNVAFETAAVEKSVDTFVREVWDAYSFEVVSYEPNARATQIRLTVDKQVAVCTELRLKLKDPNGEDQTAGIHVVTLIATDPAKTAALRAYPFG